MMNRHSRTVIRRPKSEMAEELSLARCPDCRADYQFRAGAMPLPRACLMCGQLLAVRPVKTHVWECRP